MGLFKLCPRRHHYLKVSKSVKPSSSSGAERGKTLHRVVEQYLKSSDVDDIETSSRESGLYTPDIEKGLKSLSLNQALFDELKAKEIMVEQPFMMPPFRGIIDLVVVEEGGKVSIRDHKFTSQKRYIPKLKEAEEAPQTIIYSQALFSIYNNLEILTFHYDYYGTKSKWKENLELSLTRGWVLDKYQGALSESAKEVIGNYGIVSPEYASPNYFSCHAFGQACEAMSQCYGVRFYEDSDSVDGFNQCINQCINQCTNQKQTK